MDGFGDGFGDSSLGDGFGDGSLGDGFGGGPSGDGFGDDFRDGFGDDFRDVFGGGFGCGFGGAVTDAIIAFRVKAGGAVCRRDSMDPGVIFRRRHSCEKVWSSIEQCQHPFLPSESDEPAEQLVDGFIGVFDFGETFRCVFADVMIRTPGDGERWDFDRLVMRSLLETGS